MSLLVSATLLPQAAAPCSRRRPAPARRRSCRFTCSIEAWRGDGKIILLEPRRLAARAAAGRMASLLGEQVGETVGYRMRLDIRISARTRIEVVTEGVFARMILDDPELVRRSTVIFDEFHERSLDADFGLALALDVQIGAARGSQDPGDVGDARCRGVVQRCSTSRP
jgi:hypothetical protein